MKIEYYVNKDGKCEYSYLIRKRIEELKSNECDTEAHIRYMAKKNAKNHECIDCILQPVNCELTFWEDKIAVHMIAYCSLNNVPSAEAFGLRELFFDYDKYYADVSIVKTYKLNYCNRD